MTYLVLKVKNTLQYKNNNKISLNVINSNSFKAKKLNFYGICMINSLEKN